jgi:hypothetical protein
MTRSDSRIAPSTFHAVLLVTSALAGCATTGTAPPAARQDPAPAAGVPRDPRTSTEMEEIAKDLQNPVAPLMSVLLQLDYDKDFAPGDDGELWTLQIEPTIPLSLNAEWNVISRTNLPVFNVEDVPGSDESGIGDLRQSFFFTPKERAPNGVIWGAGPVFLLPTASEDFFGTEKWGIGPTGAVLKQEGPWTYGGIANHIWSFAGEGNREDVNATYLEPFVAYTTPEAWTYSGNLEATVDWEDDDTVVPMNLMVSKLLEAGGAPINVGFGLRYWLDEADGGPEGFGFRVTLTPVLSR